YAYDVIVFGNREFHKLLTTPDGRAVFRSLLLSQVPLATVSPFVTTGPAPVEMFFGRESELRHITEHVSGSNFVLIGGRRIGKTSVLKALERSRLPQAGLRALFHDCSYTPTSAALVEATTTGYWFSLEPSPKPRSFAAVIQALPHDKPLVILLDEFDKL